MRSQAYPNSDRRAEEPPVWLHQCNWHRPHGGINCTCGTISSSYITCAKDQMVKRWSKNHRKALKQAPTHNLSGKNWVKECEFRERDFALRAREVSVKESELDIKRKEQDRGLVTSPFTLALVAATTAALANVFVAFHNGDEQRLLEQSQAEHARIVTAITGDEKTASAKLRFLLDTHLITDETSRKYILSYIDTPQVTNPPNVAIATTPTPSATSSSPTPTSSESLTPSPTPSNRNSWCLDNSSSVTDPIDQEGVG